MAELIMYIRFYLYSSIRISLGCRVQSVFEPGPLSLGVRLVSLMVPRIVTPLIVGRSRMIVFVFKVEVTRVICYYF